ncbi:MAG: hypothetical protein H7287_03875 [Thermoleophilia bacterium]|nr:hypothetical protein [Thermoleophilia bacterium]
MTSTSTVATNALPEVRPVVGSQPVGLAELRVARPTPVRLATSLVGCVLWVWLLAQPIAGGEVDVAQIVLSGLSILIVGVWAVLYVRRTKLELNEDEIVYVDWRNRRRHMPRDRGTQLKAVRSHGAAWALVPPEGKPIVLRVEAWHLDDHARLAALRSGLAVSSSEGVVPVGGMPGIQRVNSVTATMRVRRPSAW